MPYTCRSTQVIQPSLLGDSRVDKQSSGSHHSSQTWNNYVLSSRKTLLRLRLYNYFIIVSKFNNYINQPKSWKLYNSRDHHHFSEASMPYKFSASRLIRAANWSTPFLFCSLVLRRIDTCWQQLQIMKILLETENYLLKKHKGKGA